MDSDFISYAVTSVALFLLSGVLTAVIFFISRKAKKVRLTRESGEDSFENQSISECSGSARVRHADKNERRITALPNMDFPSANQESAPPIANPTETHVHPEPLCQTIIERLEIANCKAEIGPTVNSPDGSIEGQILRLEGGEQIVVIEKVLPSDHPALEPWLRLSKGIVMPGTGQGDPIFINRFQDFLSDKIAL